jgi:hypothetical protein
LTRKATRMTKIWNAVQWATIGVAGTIAVLVFTMVVTSALYALTGQCQPSLWAGCR